MEKIELKSKKIYGLTIRTNNKKEMNPQTAQIGALWGKYFEKVLPSLPTNSKGYGVYSNYESDAFGNFDVMAGAEVENENLATVTLQEGMYLCCKAEGKLPQAVIETWGKIWDYFADKNCFERRAFKTDFEVYLSESEAEIYIGVL